MEKSNQLPKTEGCLAEGEPVDPGHYRVERPLRSVSREKREPQAGVASGLSNTASKAADASAENPTPPGLLERSPAQPPQGLPGFSPVGGEGDFGGRTGSRKSARPRHTTCSVSHPGASTRYSAILGVSSFNASRLQRLGSRTGFGTGMRMAPRSGQKRLF